MNRIIFSAFLAVGFHIVLITLMPTILKKNNLTKVPEIRSVMVTLSYRQLDARKETPVKKPIEKIKTHPPEPTPEKTIIFTPKEKIRPVPEKKKPDKLIKKKNQNKPVIHQQKKIKKRPLIPEKQAPTPKQTTPVKIKPLKVIPVETTIPADTAATVDSKSPPKESLKELTSKRLSPALKKAGPEKNKAGKQARIEFAKPLYKKNALPAYPPRAKRRGCQGIVELMVLVSKKGEVSSLKIFKSSGYRSLDQQAVKTVKTWRFEPGKKNGLPQEMWVKIPVRFKLR